MYTSIKNVQIIIALLKSYGIRHIVISPGSRNIPFTASVENDDYFKCYSIVDERSAAFFGIGLIQQLKEPVVICCTSGTAVCNYISAVTEAFYQKLPLVVVTADRDKYCLNQLEDQDIPQMSFFSRITKKSVNVPIIESDREFDYSVRIVNEALLELFHHGTGPVHLNMQIAIGPQETDFSLAELPQIRKINRHMVNKKDSLKEFAQRLSSAKKVMVIYGQSQPASKEMRESVEKFFNSFNCFIAVELMSNIKCNGCIDIDNAPHFPTPELIQEYIPEIVISVNGNFLSDYKGQMKRNWNFEHWLVCEEGYLADPYHKLTEIFEGSTKDFFDTMSSYAQKKRSDYSYYELWKNHVDNLPVANDEYCDIYAVKKFMECIPENSVLHMANSSSVRLAQIFKLKDNIQVYCNRGTNGIDGSMSSFIGNAIATDSLCFLVIGDLSFFYDMNALWNRYIGKNIRIMLNNNFGAGIFHYIRKKEMFPSLDLHTAAEHDGQAKSWVESRGFRYLSAHNKEEFDVAIKEFVSSQSDKPIIMEVFTDKEEDAKALRNYYSSAPIDNKTKIKKGLKKMIKKVIGE